MLILIDGRVKGRDFLDNLRAAIAANQPERAVFEAMFPEWFPKPEQDPFAKAKRADGTYDIDEVDPSKIKWSVPASEAEAQELEEWIAARGGAVTGAQLRGDHQWH